MAKIGSYSTPAGNVPAVINRFDGERYDVVTLGYASTRKQALPSEVTFDSGADPSMLYVATLADFSTQIAADLGVTVSGDEITIPDGLLVVPVGIVDLGTAYIVLAGGQIQGRNAGLDGFLSMATAGVIRSADGTLVLTNFIVVAPAGPGIVATGTPGQFAKLIMVGVYSSPLAFDFTGFEVPSITSCYVGAFPGFPDPVVGIRYSGTTQKVHVQDTPFYDVTDACIVLSSDLVTSEVDIAGNFYEATTGVKFLRGEPGHEITLYGEVNRNLPKGSTPTPEDVLDGIDRFDPKWNFKANPNIPDSKALGGFFQGTGFETTVITTASTPVKANLTVTESNFVQRFTASADGTLTYTGIRPRTVTVNVTGRVDTATNNQEVRFTLYQDGVPVPESAAVVRVATGGDQRLFATSCILLVDTPGTDLELYVENLSGTENILLSDVNLKAAS